MFPGQTEAQTDRQDEGLHRSSSDGTGKDLLTPCGYTECLHFNSNYAVSHRFLCDRPRVVCGIRTDWYAVHQGRSVVFRQSANYRLAVFEVILIYCSFGNFGLQGGLTFLLKRVEMKWKS